ncbi:hypothetical protein [Quadrisphaera sp. DSM 44207]|uniref:hypothetical protein n=1 Tax=Quadrisphaera sp. DSM 44207 TaxID=1881057 RepID=UPI00088FED41|nr:hypothetical protein [Quadrisphaera sp. DSM 44207]SDQ49316.1 hypothetical protein SAMN05428996_1919 [Quadrisphaera sp. DSM 44207]
MPEPRETVVLLTEEPVQAADAERIIALHEGEDLLYRVLVPTDTERNLLAEVVDRLSLGQLRQALDAVRGPDPQRARAQAQEVLDATLFSLRERGRDADGALTADDPLPALEQAVRGHGAREVVVVTRPRALEDTFHRDWASRAREELGVPVLHLYGGTTFLG